MASGSIAPAQLRLEDGDATQLLSDLRSMFDDPLFSDFCFLCKDGVKVPASRLFLMARSEVLKRMLSNGMAESRKSEISLPEITSSALLPTLEYLYTGSITKHEMEPESAFLVLHAADFFQISALEEHLKSRLHTAVSSSSEPPTTLARYLSILDGHCISDLLDDVVNVILVSLRRSCCTTHPTAFLRHLSSQAMHLLCRSLKVLESWSSTFFSFMEYICVRSILLWGASQVSPEAEVFFERALPDEDVLVMRFPALKASGKTFLEVGLEREKIEGGELLTDEELQHVKAVQEILSNTPWAQKELRLHCIHPVILVTVLKPLHIFDFAFSRFEEVLQYQAFHMGDTIMKWVFPPEENIHNNYEVQENGFLLAAKGCASDQLSYAFTSIAFTKPNGFYETSFIVEEPARRIGIAVYCAHAYSRHKDTLMSVGNFWCEGRSTQLFTCHNGNPSKQMITPLQKGDRIGVVVDMREQKCVFRIKEVQLVLESLLEEVYLAACCLPLGKLRVVLVSGNTFL